MEEKIITWKKRPFSWSQMSSFEYSADQWYRKYYLGEKQKTSAEMEFGKDVGERLASDPSFMPEVPRQKHMEYGVQVKLGDVELVGYFDSFDEDKKILREYKTGKKEWNQKRVDSHGQIDMYLLLLWLDKKIKPEHVSVFLHWMPTAEQEGSFKDWIDGKRIISFVEKSKPLMFQTSRTMRDILIFSARINKTIKEMEDYCILRNSGV